MFEVFPSMKTQFAQISLPRLSQILTEPKPHCLAHHFDQVLQSFFEKRDEVEQEALSEPFRAIYSYPFQRQEFYQLLNRSLMKILKRELKKIEELINLHSRNKQQIEFNRIKLDKVLKDCFGRIGESSGCIHDFVIDMEAEHQWDCNCMKQVCEQRQSSDQFVQDIFSFFARSSQSINTEMQSAVQRNIILHTLLTNADELCNKQWAFGHKAGQLTFQIENSCQKAKKVKKRKRNKKAKQKQEQSSKPQQEALEGDEEETNLNAFLSVLQVVDLDDRQNCVVTEEWLQKIGKRSHPNSKK